MAISSISLQLYTVRDLLSSDIPGTLEQVADAGFDSVELFGFVDHVAAYHTALSAVGLAAPSAHALLLGKDLHPLFDAAQRLGVHTLIDPDIDRARWTSRDDVADAARELNEVARQAAEHGLTVGYHNHWWEVENNFNGATALEIFADHLDDDVILEVDTFWVEVGGHSAIQLLLSLGERVKFLHIKDGPISMDPDDQVALGRGDVDLLGILAAAPSAVAVVELDGTRGDIMQALRDSIAYLRDS